MFLDFQNKRVVCKDGNKQIVITEQQAKDCANEAAFVAAYGSASKYKMPDADAKAVYAKYCPSAVVAQAPEAPAKPGKPTPSAPLAPATPNAN